MNFLRKALWVFSAATLLLTSCDKDDDNKKEFELGEKNGILLVSFGSSFPDPQLTFEKLEDATKAKFVGEEIRWGFTSDIIINKLRKGEGEGTLNGTIIDNDTPEEALRLMAEDGYGKFSIQSLHVIPGEEFDELKEAVEQFKHKYPGVEVAVGKPLLDSDKDIEDVAKVLANQFKMKIIDGPVLFMGHGTPHEADNRYGKLQTELQKNNANFFVGTVEGIGFGEGEEEGKGPMAIGSIVEKLKELSTQPTSVTITPLMSIAGDHANNDMNGNTGESDPAEQSWKERLEGAGYTVNCIMKGLGDYDEINQIWLNHLEAVKLQ